MRDANEYYLGQYEGEQDRAFEEYEAASSLAEFNAGNDVCKPKVLTELIYDYEISPADCLARCFVNLERACKGQQIALDAITTALHQLNRTMVAKREKLIFDDCVEAVNEPPLD